MATEVEGATRGGGRAALPREMQRHTYRIMREVEGSHWWFAGRRRILESFIERIVASIDPPPGARPRILDVGCGTGANLEMLARFGDAVGVDVSEDALDFCRGRGLAGVHEGAAEALPFAAGQFDLVTALDVVEHLDDDAAGLREMRRVLRPRGCALLFVPAFMWLWGVQDDVSHHRRRYTVPMLRARVEAAGFAVERATYANATFLAPILAGRLLMRATGLRPASENNINVSALNGALGRLLGAEALWLRRFDFPVGVSALIVARKVN